MDRTSLSIVTLRRNLSIYKCISLPKGGSIHFNMILRNMGPIVDKINNIMLVGTGECGKTTFFKQYKLHNESYNVKHSNIVFVVILSCTIKCLHMIKQNKKFSNPNNVKFMDWILEVSKLEITTGSDSQYVKVMNIPLIFSAIVSLWNEPVMFEVLNSIKMNHFCNPDLFFMNLKRINIKEDYKPFLEDLKLLMKSSIEIFLKQKYKCTNQPIQTMIEDISKKKKTLDINTLFFLLCEAEIVSMVKTHWNLFPKQLNKMSITSKLVFQYYHLLKKQNFESPEFEATIDDILMISTKTTGIIMDTPSVYRNKDICLVDTGGQQSERQKWTKFKSSQTATCIIYMIDLSSYNEICYESNDNRMLDDLKALATISEVVGTSKLILFFNKFDLFVKKIQSHDMTIFPNYKGGKNSEKGLNFLMETYRSVVESKKVANYHEYVGSALSWSDISTILDMATQQVHELKKSHYSQEKLSKILSDFSVIDADETQFSDLSQQLDSLQVTDVSDVDHPDIINIMMKKNVVLHIDTDPTDADHLSDDEKSFDLSKILDGERDDDTDDDNDHPDIVWAMKK